MKIRIAALTDKGAIRDHNEDNYLVNPDLNQDQWFPTPPDKPEGTELSSAGAIIAVADGMGGMSAGEVASEISVNTLQALAPSLLSFKKEQIGEAMNAAFKEINQAIVQYGKEAPEAEGMGTTLIYTWIVDNIAHISWVGDSRAYLFRPGNEEGKRLVPVSKDHSLVQEWIDEGRLTDEQAFYHPQNNIVTQSLGDPENPPSPTYNSIGLQEGDQLMLCSDGLNGMLLDPLIEEIMTAHYGQPKVAAKALINAAIDAGGHDNITIVIAHIGKTAIIPTATKSTFNRPSQNTIGDDKLMNVAPVASQLKPSSKTKRNLWFILSAAVSVVLLGFVYFVLKPGNIEMAAEPDGSPENTTVTRPQSGSDNNMETDNNTEALTTTGEDKPTTTHEKKANSPTISAEDRIKVMNEKRKEEEENAKKVLKNAGINTDKADTTKVKPLTKINKDTTKNKQ